MAESTVVVTMLTGRYAGWDLRKPRSEAENLIMTGQARRIEQRPTAAPETPESPAPRSLSQLTKDELVALADERGVEVVRADGEDGEPLKADYLRALSEA